MGYGRMDGCGSFMKYTLFLLNFTVFLGGCTIIGLAAFALTDSLPSIGKILGSELLTGSIYILLVGGIIITLISFFGCIGASREVKCMLLTYSIIVFLLFTVILIGGILGYVFKDKVFEGMDQTVINSMRDYNKNEVTRDAWDDIQKHWKCCGAHKSDDWITYAERVPTSCCTPENINKCDTTNPAFLYKDGCLDKAQGYIAKHSKQLGISGIIVAVIMFFSITFSCALFRMI